VKTEMIAKIPMVIPSKDKKVLSLFDTRESTANLKLSANSLKNNMAQRYEIVALALGT
jgi:hypothetical protein